MTKNNFMYIIPFTEISKYMILKFPLTSIVR